MNRLLIFNDPLIEGSFIFRTKEEMVARADKSAGKWRVWFYHIHTQRSYMKLREAAADINRLFINLHRNEIH